MKLMLIQYRPAVRLYKWATTLKSEGHHIVIGCTQQPVRGLDWGKFDMRTVSVLTDFKGFDYIISFNPNLPISHPRTDRPVIQAVGDLRSVFQRNNREVEVLRKAHKCVFISENQMQWAVDNLHVDPGKCSVVYNGIISEFSTAKLPKINTGKINLVYEGTTSHLDGHNRNILEILKELSVNKKYTITVYPSSLGISEIYQIPGIDIKPMVSPYQIITELSQYHAGLILMTDKEIGKTAMPNKLFEYVAAGLTVVTHPYMKNIQRWNQGKDVVQFDFDNIKPLPSNKVVRHTEHYNNLSRVFNN